MVSLQGIFIARYSRTYHRSAFDFRGVRNDRRTAVRYPPRDNHCGGNTKQQPGAAIFWLILLTYHPVDRTLPKARICG